MVKEDYEIGLLRAKYLDLANVTFTQEQYNACEGYIDSFLETIPEGGKPADVIKTEFDKIEHRKNKQRKELNEFLKDKGELERTDIKLQGEKDIVIEGLHDKKTVCWMVARDNGLFNG